MNLETIEKKARDGSLEVEHLLSAAAARPTGLSSLLRRLSSELGWARLHPDGMPHFAPFADWAEVAARYSDSGLDSLPVLLNRPGYPSLVLALLVELGSSQAVDALMSGFAETMRSPRADLSRSLEVAATINLLLSFKEAPSISATQAADLRCFLHSLLSSDLEEARRATVFYALRGVGDAETVRILQAARDFAYPYDKLKGKVLRAIRKRIKSEDSRKGRIV